MISPELIELRRKMHAERIKVVRVRSDRLEKEFSESIQIEYTRSVERVRQINKHRM